jgi:hypothetical protein
VSSILMRAVDKYADWSLRPDGPGRYVLITDPDKAPRLAQTSLPVGFWLLIAAFLGALLFAVLNNMFEWF